MIDILFPTPCLLCGNELKNSIVCSRCFSLFNFINNTEVCEKCGVPFSGFNEKSARLCGGCIENKDSMLAVRSVLLYKDNLKELLHSYKYGSKLFLADYFSDLIASRFPFDQGGIDIVVPVPLYIKRLRERGYNQTVLIARGLSKKLGLSINLFSLKKIRDTKPQVEMKDFKKREQNVKNSFQVIDEKIFSGKSVLLVDDVYTSGSTIRECSKQLLKSGAKYVLGLTIARAI